MSENEPKELTPGERRIRDANFFIEHEQEYRLQYPEERVAVVDEQLVGHHISLRTLLDDLKRQGFRERAFIALPMSDEEHEELSRFVSEMSFNSILHQLRDEQSS
jgi:hypothetical protein